MSEQKQESNNIAENTVVAAAEPKKENFFKRAWKNPKVRKALSWAERVTEVALVGAVSYAAGRKSANKAIPVEGHLEGPSEDIDDDTDAE